MMKVKYSEIYELDPAHFLSGPGLVQSVVSKKKKVKLDLLTDFDILLMIQKGIGRGYASLFIDMQKLPVNDFKLTEDISELDQDFIESYNDGSDGEHFFEIDVQ